MGAHTPRLPKWPTPYRAAAARENSGLKSSEAPWTHQAETAKLHMTEWMRRACPGCCELEPEAQQIHPFGNSLIERLLCAGHFLDAGAAAGNRLCEALQFQLLKGPCHFKLAQGKQVIRRPRSHIQSPLQENLPLKKEHLPTSDKRRRHEMLMHISGDLTCFVKPRLTSNGSWASLTSPTL